MVEKPDEQADLATKLQAKEARKAARRDAKLREKAAQEAVRLREKEAQDAVRQDAKLQARKASKFEATRGGTAAGGTAQRRHPGITDVNHQRIVPVRQPIVLISQVQRSGGHLLARLFDGHPACVSHPHELKWGRPKKGDWPSFDVDATRDPDALFALLSEKWQDDAVAAGGMRAAPGEAARYPFRFDLVLHQELFKALLGAWPVASRRDALDAYLTASFNAWLDYRGLDAAPKRYVTAFVPRVTMAPGSLDRFFTDYADGHLITIVRHPGSWLASALRSKTLAREHDGDADAALRIWSASTEASLQAATQFGEQVTIVLFEDLVHRTHDVMARVCGTLGLDLHPCLVTPTFNGMPVRSNSLHRPVEGIDTGATERHRVLSEQQAAAVAAALPRYQEVASRYGVRLGQGVS